MNNVNQYDKRQLKLMQKCLNSFEKNQVGLSSLIGSLEFLLNAMKSVDSDWENKFLKEVTTLESINATELMEGLELETTKSIDNERITLINVAVSNLKIMIQEELDSRPTTNSDEYA